MYQWYNALVIDRNVFENITIKYKWLFEGVNEFTLAREDTDNVMSMTLRVYGTE